jgi:hypothetical protein
MSNQNHRLAESSLSEEMVTSSPKWLLPLLTTSTTELLRSTAAGMAAAEALALLQGASPSLSAADVGSESSDPISRYHS